MYVNQDKGIVAGLASGFFWGTLFVVPMILHTYTAIDITLGRFLFFGIFSLIYAKQSWQLFISFNLQQRLKLILLATTGFWLYTLTLSKGVQLTNGVTSALIAGSSPVVVAIFSKPRLTLKFISGLMLILIGLMFLVLPEVLSARHNSSANDTSILGILILLIALAMWSWFAIHNAKFLSTNHKVKGIEYTSLIGIINMLMVVPIFLTQSSFEQLINHEQFSIYLICSVVLGVGASWIANIFWAYCSKNCPATIVGALIVSETLFGLCYSFIYQQRLPFWNEYIAIIGLLSGVVLVIFSQRIKAH